jgi:cystathionine gamma-synthase
MNDNYVQLGSSLPQYTPHAISVSLPKWKDAIDYELGSPRVIDQLKCGYPRFVFHPIVKNLFENLQNIYLSKNYKCLVFLHNDIAQRCKSYIESKVGSDSSCSIKTVQVALYDIHMCVFPSEFRNLAKQFWQHTGEGISSRAAEKILNVLTNKVSDSNDEFAEFIEEHFGRNLKNDLANGVVAKAAIKDRLSKAHNVDANSVYLYPCGMSAIYNSYNMFASLNPTKKICIQFGFPYLDTLKILKRFSDDHIFYGFGDNDDLEHLKHHLEHSQDSPIALFCEFPSNPLLKSADLTALRNLSKKHKFPIVVDDTMANILNVGMFLIFLNLEILPFCDVMVTSLTKIFSGYCNVMAGR